MYELIKVELGERRGVEEIGLALVGGRFDLQKATGLAQAPPVQQQPAKPSGYPAPAAGRTPSPSGGLQRRRQVAQEQPQVWTLHDAPSPSSSSRSATPRGHTPPRSTGSLPPLGHQPWLSKSHASTTPSGSSPPQPQKGFKPSPVDFDFVIGGSSVKKKAPKPKKKREEEKPKPSGSGPPPPPRRSAPVHPAADAGRPAQRTPRKAGAPQRGPATRQEEHSARRSSKGQSRAAEPERESPQRKQGLPSREPELRAEAEAEPVAAVAGQPTLATTEPPPAPPEDHALEDAVEEPDPGEARYGEPVLPEAESEREALPQDLPKEPDAEVLAEDPGDNELPVAAADEKVEDLASQEAADSVLGGEAGTAEHFQSHQELQDTAADEAELKPRHEAEDASPHGAMASDAGYEDTEPQEPRVLYNSCRMPAQSRPLEDEPSFVEPSEDATPKAFELDSSPVATLQEVSDNTPRVASSSPPAEKAGRSAGPGEVEALERRRLRRPPLPKEALKAINQRAQVVRGNELDFVGLDPGLLARGEIRNYAEHFPSISSIFTWAVQQTEKSSEVRERLVREALQLFTQFVDIITSLEVQFTRDLAPADHTTPSATQQALSAMCSRGAGLYGVFLKGIIEKISERPEPVSRAVAPPVPPDVCSLRYYKVVQNRTEVYDIVTQVFHKKEGWEELPHGLGLSNAWNLCWTWSKPRLDYSRLLVWQKVNHYPENKHLTRKDCLKRCFDRYIRGGGKLSQFFNICPKTFILPKEYTLFVEFFGKVDEENLQTAELEAGSKDIVPNSGGRTPGRRKVPNLWIMKPAGSSRGRGIQVVNDCCAVHYGELTIIQQYISDPYLIDGFKWDMRTYVTVTSFNPLEAFIYKDGFARFTTVPFSTDVEDLDNKLVHLTNSSIQRHNEESMMQGDFTKAEDVVRQQDAMLGGTKISFVTLQQRLKARGVDWALVWSRMIEVVLKSLCMAEDHIPHQVNSFELFGYDLLLDSKQRVWLIEVNSSPSMGQEHLLDEQVKLPLINDTIDLVDPIEFDRRKLTEVLHRRVEKKATVATASRQQLDMDMHAILKGQVPRSFGEMPKHLGNYERIAPSDMCDSIMRTRGLLFKQ